MNKKLNKLVTNYPVELNEEEIENLSATLAPVIAACGGGGTSGKIYTGTGFVNVNNTTNQIGLTEDANDKLNKEYVEYNEYSTAIDNRYTKTQTNALLDEKQDTLEFEYDENNKVSAINGSALAGQGGGDVNYSAGTDLKIENNIISVDTNGNPNNTASNTRNFVEGSWTVASGYNSHAEGMATTAYGYAVHAQGMWTKFSSSKWSDNDHPTPIDIYWAAGAGATVEGYCNATTSCPMSGTEGKSDYGPIHGGILKVIGNGNVVHDQSVDPDAHIHRLQPSDALIIFKDGCISAAGNISANGIELGEGGTSYQGRSGVNVVGDYIELTQTAYNAVTSIAGLSTDVGTLKVASADWNKVSAKLDTTAFSTVSGNFLTDEDLDEYATKSDLETTSGELLTTAQYQTDSATFLTAIPDTYALKTDIPATVAQLEDSGNYYQKTETSSKDELSNEFAKYVTSSNVTTQDKDYVMTTTGWKVLTLPGGGMTQVIHDETLTGQGNADNSKLSVAWSALSGNTINSAKSAGSSTSADKAESAVSAKWLREGDAHVSAGDVTALQNWASSNSSTWDEVSAKLGTAQYANDSATFVTSSNSTITGTKQYALTTAGWSDIGLDEYVPYSATNLAIGSDVDASAYSFAQGWDNSANWNSVTFGTHSTAYSRSLAVGENAVADSHSLSIGGGANSHCNSADGQSIAVGNGVSARYRSIAVGSHSTVADTNALSIGGYCVASGTGSVAIGFRNSAYNEMFTGGSEAGGQAFGRSLEISGGLAIGSYNATKDAAFVIGDGTGNDDDTVVNRSDSFVIYRDGSVSAKGDISANGVKLGAGGGTSYQGRNGVNVDGGYIELTQTAYNAVTSVSSKVDKPDTTQTELNNNYLIYSTLTAAGTTTGWIPLSANYYSKSEANGTFVATANIDTTTLSGNGKSSSTKLGVDTNVIATKDYVNSSFLPLSGGTVSGELVVSAATGTFDNSYVKCVNDGNAGYSRFGVGSYGGAVIKTVNGNNNVQVNVKYNANNNELIQVQKNGTDIGFLIPAVTSTTTAGLTNDGILHIILES